MLKRRGRRGHPALGVVLSLLVVMGAIVAGISAADADDPSPDLSGLPHGVTVSWPPTSKPVVIQPGTTSTATFWVTNDTAQTVPITITPATAVPGDDGSMAVSDGADQRFPSITLKPSKFDAAAGSTTEVKETVVSPADLPAGVYLLPAVVRPQDPTGNGNIKIQRSLVGLTTFQVPGDVNIALSASLVQSDAPAGTLTRKIPGLPLIEIGRSAGATLRVASESDAGFYAYYEVTGTTSGIGSLTFDGHTDGLPADLRVGQSLYFPGTHRDFPVTWKADALGAAEEKLVANVSFNPSPNQVRSVSASETLVVISTWWVAVALALLMLLALVSLQRTRGSLRQQGRRRRRSERREGHVSQAAAGIVLAVLAVAAGALAVVWLMAGVIVVGTVGVAGAARMSRRQSSSTGLSWLVPANLAALIAIVVAGLLLAATFVKDLSPGYALAVLAGTAWLLLMVNVIRSSSGRKPAVPTEPETLLPTH